MQGQRVFVKGRTFSCDDPALQEALAALYETPERPRCMCVPGGVELYISKRATFVLARMPGTGGQHHPSCHDYEPAPGTSGRGALIDDAIVQRTPDSIDVYVNFPLSRRAGKALPRGEADAPTEVLCAQTSHEPAGAAAHPVRRCPLQPLVSGDGGYA